MRWAAYYLNLLGLNQHKTHIMFKSGLGHDDRGDEIAMRCHHSARYAMGEIEVSTSWLEDLTRETFVPAIRSSLVHELMHAVLDPLQECFLEATATARAEHDGADESLRRWWDDVEEDVTTHLELAIGRAERK